ncbi:MAG: DUF5005 domain-containing protein, partial [Reichenbachiella sp.]
MQLLNQLKYVLFNLFVFGPFLGLTVLSSSCTSNKNRSNDPELIVESDKEFDDFFTRRKPGFTGGDGTYSVNLPNGTNIWIFGDTFIG